MGTAGATGDDWISATIRVGLCGVLVLAPLPFGAVRGWSVLALELAAATLGGLALWKVWRSPGSLSRPARVMLLPAAVLLAIGLAQLVPLPNGVANVVVPPTAAARAAVAGVVPELAASAAPLSLAPPDTADALLRLAAFVLFALAAAVGFREPRHLKGLALVLVASGAFQALYGASEYVSGRQHIFGFAKRYYLDSATGTFINRNHYAAYLAATLPFAAGWLLDGLRRLPSSGGWRYRLGAIGDRGLFRLLSGVVVLFLIGLGVLLSYSRSGLVAALVGVVVLAAVVRQRRGGLWVAGAALLLPAFYLSWVEVRAPAERFVAERQELTSLNGRLPVWERTLALVADYPVVGSGYGTFESAFYVHSAQAGLRWDHAHNDWLQGLLEGGPLATLAVLMLAGGVFLARRSGREIDPYTPLFHASAVAACAALLFHAFLDFPLRIPAVALTLAAIAGALWGQTSYFGLAASDPGPVALRGRRRRECMTQPESRRIA